MRTSKLSRFARLIGALAAVVAAAGMSLEVWCALDRAHAGAPNVSPEAAVHSVLARPSAATFSRLARVDAAAGNPNGAAYAAGVAARISPHDPVLAAEAERAVDAAVRAHLLLSARPAAAGALGMLGLLGAAAWRRRRVERAIARTMGHARGHLRVTPEGTRKAPGNDGMVDEGTRALVVDAEIPPMIARLRCAPAAVVYLSNSAANRTIRLSPRTDVGSGAVRWRIEGDTLAAIAAAPGRWRAILRLGAATLAESSFLVTPLARVRVA